MAGRGQTCGAEGVTKVTPPIASGRFRPELPDPHEVAQILLVLEARARVAAHRQGARWLGPVARRPGHCHPAARRDVHGPAAARAREP